MAKLDTPQNVSASGTTVSFDNVYKSTSYEFFSNGVSIGTKNVTPTAETYLKTSNTYVNKINKQKIRRIITSTTEYNIAGVKYFNKLDKPTNLSASGTTVSFDEVANATSYEFFANGVSIGIKEI